MRLRLLVEQLPGDPGELVDTLVGETIQWPADVQLHVRAEDEPLPRAAIPGGGPGEDEGDGVAVLSAAAGRIGASGRASVSGSMKKPAGGSPVGAWMACRAARPGIARTGGAGAMGYAAGASDARAWVRGDTPDLAISAWT